MFDRFTDRARQVMGLSRQEAQRLNHDYIGTEHILLGIVFEGTGIASDVLTNPDRDLRIIRRSVEKLIQPGTFMVTMGQLPFTPGAKTSLELAYDEASNAEHDFIGTGHLLLGLIREKKGVAAQVLEHHGVGLAEVRKEVVKLFASEVDHADVLDRAVAVQPRALETVHLLGLDDGRLSDEQCLEVGRAVASLALTCVPENSADVLIVFAPDLDGLAMYEIGVAVGEGRVVLLLGPPDGTMPPRISKWVHAIPLGPDTGDCIRTVLETP